MYLTLSEYIKSIEKLNAAGTKDTKIRDLLEYYQRYNCSVTPGPGVFYAVIYARYSSHSQRDESIEGQVREDLEYASRNNMIVLGVYIDRALTGKEIDKRISFQQMIKDSTRGKWQYVITWKVDRFARNRYDAAIYKARLKKHNVRVVYAREQIPDGPEGILLESVLEGQAEYYSASLSQNIRRGQEDNAMECKVNGSIPLGYRVGADRRFEIDPGTAPIIHTIFELYDAGHTYQDIEDYLNSRGYKTQKGGPFNKNSFNRILKNDRYIGTYRYKEVTVENGMPAIIDKELFDSVQRKIVRNRKARAHKKSDMNFLLTTKLYCGLCGKAMIGESGTGKLGGKYYYYTCVGKKRDKTCKKKPIKKDWIENLVIQETVRLILQDDMINEIADKVMEYQAREADYTVLHSLQIQLNDTEKAIKNLIAAIEQGIITPSTKNRLEELEDEKIRIMNGIAEEDTIQPVVERDQIIFYLRRFQNGDVSDPQYCQTLIDVFVNAVYVYDDRIVITYNYSGNHNTVTLEQVEQALGESKCSDTVSSAPC
ncbi:recombinase family protein [Enterocloster clostridioformis]|uniref:recombinase family protein n=1 Tax=Enterocloster clostridioformis TaxID=1531 RepID=UPI0022E716D9|nr:recombinase family protein [Enterocloster clostridioformis]